MNISEQFQKDGFTFELSTIESDSVTIVSRSGVFGHFTVYYQNTPVISNEKVIYIPESAKAPSGKNYNVIGISRGLFDSLTEVEEIFIPASIKKIAWSFWRCKKLRNIHVDSNNKYFKDVNGVLYSKDLKCLIVYPCDYASSYKVLDGVTKIANMAFKSSITIEEIELPKSLREIGINVFYGCVKLKHVYGIPRELTSFKANRSHRPIKAVFHYKNKEWTMEEIVNEFINS